MSWVSNLYLEPEKPVPAEEAANSPFGTPDLQNKLTQYYEKQTNFSAFQGRGGRIDGKKKNTKGVKLTVDLDKVYQRGVPNYDWDERTLNFIRNPPPKKVEEEAGERNRFFIYCDVRL
jgi:hypothetical protein